MQKGTKVKASRAAQGQLASTHSPLPYTTLFRSIPIPKTNPKLAAERARTLRQFRGGRDPKAAKRHLGPAELSQRSRPLDRKSTRLNSSHSQISYAVFCLKKKSNS